MRPKTSLVDVGEFGFLRRLLPTLRQSRDVLVGPGDDCAVVRGGLLLTTDALVEDVHFRRAWLTPEQIGSKAILVNLSDVAAMGGRPRFALLSLGVPVDFGRDALARLHRGAERAAREAGVSIVGGNLSAAEKLFVSVTLVGEARQPVLRRGAAAGDLVFVTGTLGDAAAAVQLLRLRGRVLAPSRRGSAVAQRSRLSSPKRRVGAARAQELLLRRFAAPTARLETGRRLADAGVVSAMIDVSDGLVQDLGHICAASGTGAVVFEGNVPLSAAYEAVIGPDATLALQGGEDYELLFTVSPAQLARFERLRQRLPDCVTFVGEIVSRPRGVRVRDARGRLRRSPVGGFQHFATA